MSTFKPFPELVVDASDPTLPKIMTKSGDDFMAFIVQRDLEDVQRMVDCWNACRKLHNPAAHIETTEDRVTKLEQLRKEAWARAVELGASDFRGTGENAA